MSCEWFKVPSLHRGRRQLTCDASLLGASGPSEGRLRSDRDHNFLGSIGEKKLARVNQLLTYTVGLLSDMHPNNDME